MRYELTEHRAAPVEFPPILLPSTNAVPQAAPSCAQNRQAKERGEKGHSYEPLCATLAPAQGWALRREPESAAAFLSVPSHPETFAAGSPVALFGFARSDRRRFASSRCSLCRGRLGEPDARRLGACGAMAWRF